ncbi:hypothetical protein MTO96_023928 [Rhipicephalus appendiculatus]
MEDEEDVSAPSFLHKPTLREEDDGNRLVFECQMRSHPRPEISWFRGDVQLHDDHRTAIRVVEIEPRKYHVSLELNDVIESDGGPLQGVRQEPRGSGRLLHQPQLQP